MFSQPLLAHPAEIRGVHGTSHPRSMDKHDRAQYDDGDGDEEHMVLAAILLRRIAIVACLRAAVCALVH
jgi:hypothetical protein